MICDDAVSRATLNHVVRHITPTAIDEATDEIVATIEFGNRRELMLIQKTLYERAIHFLADAPIPPVNHVINLLRIGQRDMRQIAEHIVTIEGRLPALDLALQLAVGS